MVSHLRRPAQSPHDPVHVTLRVRRDVPSLQGRLFAAVRGALAAGRERFGSRLVHFSVQRDHLHLLVEAQHRSALARGMQGLSIRIAKAVNRALNRTGSVFADRYHSRALKTPREVRWALRYVLLNAKKHSRGAQALTGFVDSRSSAAWFDGFNRPRELAFRASIMASPKTHGEDPPIVAPRTWLLRVGYRRAGPLFDIDDVPG